MNTSKWKWVYNLMNHEVLEMDSVHGLPVSSIPVHGKVDWKDGEDVTDKFTVHTEHPGLHEKDFAVPIKKEEPIEIGLVQKFMDENRAWTNIVFPTATAASCLKHLKKEAGEAIDSLDFEDIEHTKFEFADLYLLLLNAASRFGLTFRQLHETAVDKMAINKLRDWGKPNEEGFTEHIKPAHQPKKDISDKELPDIDELIKKFLPNLFELSSFKPKEILRLEAAFQQGAQVMFHTLKNREESVSSIPIIDKLNEDIGFSLDDLEKAYDAGIKRGESYISGWGYENNTPGWDEFIAQYKINK